MDFGILGPLVVRSADGTEIAVGGPRPRALLTMLLLNAGRVVSLEQLIDWQYGDAPPAGAANAVQAQVSRLRRHLPVEFDAVGYRLAVPAESVDVHRFEALAGEGRRLLASGHPAPAAATLREGLALWRGPALPDLPFGQSQVARLEELRLSALEDLAEAELLLPAGDAQTRGPGGASVAALQELVEAHPLRERLVALLMRALRAAGRQAEALAAFDAARRRLADELGADPSPELTELNLAILRADRPAPRPGVAAPLTSFVGRAAELRLLATGARLTTLVGPGGVGKTRLATEFAAREPGEVCFVDLSPVTDEAGVAPAVLGALGVRESGLQPVGDPADRLAIALADRDLLLVADNCEQVVVAVARLMRRLLGECQGLRVLVTSREALGLTGETLVPLAPLPAPPLPASPGQGAAEAAAYPSVRLFADRAAAVRPGFELTDANAAAVTAICATLDGLPLAIELAAARLRTFPVEEIAARLAADGRFRLLSRGDRTAAARHQTLTAVVGWSWDLLTPDEQEQAARFSIFAGGATLEAAEEICGDVTDLVDKSLVVIDGGRYRMMETIRLYCAAHQPPEVAAEHAAYYLELARRADDHLRGAEQLEWLAALTADHANLMAALRHDPRTGRQMISALAAYWWLSGRRSEAGELAAGLLEEQPGQEEDYVSCVVHAVPRVEPSHWERAAAIIRGARTPFRHPFVVAMFGMLAGPFDSDNHTLLDSEPWTRALNRLGRALLQAMGGDPAGAERELEAVLAAFRTLGERWGVAQGLDGLAMVATWRGQWRRARELRGEALVLLEELGALEECGDILVRRAEALVREGDLKGAADDYRRADELFRKAGQPGRSTLGLGELARLEGRLDEAGALLERALEEAGQGGFVVEGAQARALTALGRLARARGDAPDEARAFHERAVGLARRSPLACDLADAVEGLAGAVPPDDAALLLGVAVALRGTAAVGDPDVARTAEAVRDRPEIFARGAAMSREEALTTLDRIVSD
ncbi:BTAD domain-containing putative transcriptional regulator [Nonomuraea soli]|uniref:Putative ATPase n=1 Tax=Nonomuraea soli TaxID=1032476 RepID=A0A7W0CUE5_9ACTN|nr:BTAD domain-containing putative transcriptional regulator [Nonomuraea soli]MBA2897501.1 putative ATPase [Nonomuraea soli]